MRGRRWPDRSRWPRCETRGAPWLRERRRPARDSWRLASKREGRLTAVPRDHRTCGVDVEAEWRIERARGRDGERRMTQPGRAGRERELGEAGAPHDRRVVLASHTPAL